MSIPPSLTEDAVSSDEPAVEFNSLDPHTRRDLQMKLEEELESITTLYSRYVRHIRKSLEAKGISASDLSSDLLTVTAFDHVEQKFMLLSTHQEELEGAADLHKIFNLLVKHYASFLNYRIFQYIVGTYDIDHGHEDLKYPVHLKNYLNKLKVSEFMLINPLLETVATDSKELVLKMELESMRRLAKIRDLQTAVAKILKINSLTLRLLDISEGCIVVTFLIPAPIVYFIFNERTVLTEDQWQEFPANSIMWMKCNGCMLSFSERVVIVDVHNVDKL